MEQLFASTSGPTSDGLRVGHLNVQSMGMGKTGKSKYDMVRYLVERNCFDVFAVSETWLTQDVANTALDIPGYKFERQDRPTGHGGLLVYLQDKLKYSLGLVEQRRNDEQLITVQITAPCRVDIKVVYRPPKTSETEFLDKFGEWYRPSQVPTIITGDVNINYFEETPLSSARINTKIRNFLKNFRLAQVIQNYSRIAVNSKSASGDKGVEELTKRLARMQLDNFSITCKLLDHIYSSHPSDVVEAGVIRCGISDHDLIYCTVHSGNQVPPAIVKNISADSYQTSVVQILKSQPQTFLKVMEAIQSVLNTVSHYNVHIKLGSSATGRVIKTKMTPILKTSLLLEHEMQELQMIQESMVQSVLNTLKSQGKSNESLLDAILKKLSKVKSSVKSSSPGSISRFMSSVQVDFSKSFYENLADNWQKTMPQYKLQKELLERLVPSNYLEKLYVMLRRCRFDSHIDSSAVRMDLPLTYIFFSLMHNRVAPWMGDIMPEFVKCRTVRLSSLVKDQIMKKKKEKTANDGLCTLIYEVPRTKCTEGLVKLPKSHSWWKDYLTSASHTQAGWSHSCLWHKLVFERLADKIPNSTIQVWLDLNMGAVQFSCITRQHVEHQIKVLIDALRSTPRLGVSFVQWNIVGKVVDSKITSSRNDIATLKRNVKTEDEYNGIKFVDL